MVILQSDAPLECQQYDPSGFVCACNTTRFVLNSDGKTCSGKQQYLQQENTSFDLELFSADINECDMGSACDDRAICSNTNGSFDCTCIAGYTGSGLPGECTGIRVDLSMY